MATFSNIHRFSTTCTLLKETLREGSKFKSSSQQWLKRQINDKYVKQAAIDHYRCRSAFKLLEINKSYKILKPRQTVVDLGCAPGSWTQVAVKATQANIPGSTSLVVGIDLSPVHPIEGATLLSTQDFTTAGAQQKILEVLGGRQVDVVLSDMSPSVSGIKSLDHTNIIKLCYTALRFARSVCVPGAVLVMKVFDGGETQQLIKELRTLYQFVRIVRPDASRKESSEHFLVCLNLKPEADNQKQS